MAILGQDVFVKISKDSIVFKYPISTTKGCEYQVILPSLNLQVSYRYGRQAIFDLSPGFSSIDSDE